MKKRTFTIPVLLFLGLFSFAQTTIHVPDDQPTIQEGIDAADDGDTVLVAQGTYTENIDFNGKAIWVASHWLVEQDSAHILNTIIDGSEPNDPKWGSTVRFISGEDITSVLSGFTITGGTGTYNEEWDAWGGGGVLVQNASAKIIHNRIIGNHIETNGIDGYGAGLDLEPGEEDDLVILRDNLIEGNLITNDLAADTQILGGGIEVFLIKFIIEDNVIRDNHLEGIGRMAGGGLDLSSSSGTFINNRVEDNEISNTGFTISYAPRGAGFGLTTQSTSEFRILNNTVINNSITASDSDGGGIYIHNFGESDSLFIDGNVISYNMAARGGGMTFATQGMGCYLANNILSNNEADEFGGGILLRDQWLNKSKTIPPRINPLIDGNQPVKKDGLAMVLVNNTIANNICTNEGGGIYNQSVENDLMLFNNIIYGNSGTNGNDLAIDLSDFKTYLYNNNIDTDGIYGDGMWEGSSNINEDPNFDPDNPYHLMAGSPCIDAGTWDVEVGDITYAAPEFDIDGEERPYNTYYDIGADEVLSVQVENRSVGQGGPTLSIFPNPARNRATIVFEVMEPGPVELSIVDIHGKEVIAVMEDRVEMGACQVEFNAGMLKSGIYFCTLKTNKGTSTAKLIKLD